MNPSILVAVLACTLSLSAAFVPNGLLGFTMNIAFSSDDPLITHQDMSRAAILDVAASVLRDNPNPDNEGSTARISALTNLDAKSLIAAYYGKGQLSRVKTFERAVNEINSANANVDLGDEGRIASAHFDSEEIQAGQNRLVQLRQNIVTQILSGNNELAREETGRLFHTLQDFYSHSNWVENGNRAPYEVLRRDLPTSLALPPQPAQTAKILAKVLHIIVQITSSAICEHLGFSRLATMLARWARTEQKSPNPPTNAAMEDFWTPPVT